MLLFPTHAGLVCDEQRVLFNGRQLEDTDLLSLAGVKDEATLNILGRLLGGAKKRKKKTYTKPKKQKHKHKKIKLRVLKFYKVSFPACGMRTPLPLQCALGRSVQACTFACSVSSLAWTPAVCLTMR